jgi:hypothetical protein
MILRTKYQFEKQILDSIFGIGIHSLTNCKNDFFSRTELASTWFDYIWVLFCPRQLLNIPVEGGTKTTILSERGGGGGGVPFLSSIFKPTKNLHWFFPSILEMEMALLFICHLYSTVVLLYQHHHHHHQQHHKEHR